VPRTALATAVALIAFALGALASGPDQAGRDDRPGQIASVDFVVVSRTGQPITDLRPDEVTLRVGNRNRPIRNLQFIQVASDMRGAAAAPVDPVEPLPPAFASNMRTVADSPRSFLIVVDDESMPIGEEQKLRSALNSFIRDLPPADSVALVTVPHGGLKVGLTTDRDVLRREIANISPINPIGAPSCRTRSTLVTLETTLLRLIRPSDQPVIVAFLSASLLGQSRMEQAPTPNRGSLSAQAGICYLQTDDFARVGKALASSRAQLYIINPDYSQAAVAEGLENLQGQTGAPLFHLGAGTEPGLYRMARETSAYYVATFATDPEERNGQAQPATIRVTRRDVEVRGKPYVVLAVPAPLPASSSTTVTTAFDMVRNGRQYRDLPLRATTASFRNPDGSVNVVGWFEPLDPSVRVMTAAAALVNENGRAIAYWEGEADKMTSWPTAIGLSVPPGTYRLRLAAIDSNGRLGLVDDQLEAEIRKAGPVQISGLMLGVSAASGFAPRLQFSGEREAVAYLEMYGLPEGTDAGALIEVARTTNGPAFLTLKGTFKPTAVEGRFTVTATIPLTNLAAGSYVVRAVVAAPGQPAAKAIRTLRKTG